MYFKLSSLLYAIFFLAFLAPADAAIDSAAKPQGWNIGGILPDLGYDSDLGFNYGIIGSLYDYGHVGIYPNYEQYMYLDVFFTTNGNNTNVFVYDTKKLFGSKLRFVGEVSYITEQALDFYGFNGVDLYTKDFVTNSSPVYKSRMYFRYKREMLRIAANLRGNITADSKIKWICGITDYLIKINSVDIAKLNRSLKQNDKLPSVDSVPGIYEQYVSRGLIGADEKNGGNAFLLRAGLMADTRDFEVFPNKGLWSDIMLQFAPPAINKSGYAQLILTHRQYFTLLENVLVFAYRLSLNTRLYGDIPFYMLPFNYNYVMDGDGLGGVKTARGILRNRVISENEFFSNFELRWKLLTTKIFGQDFYIALAAFSDACKVTFKPEHLNLAPENMRWHISAGGGLYLALNNNFVLAIDFGKALNRRDGNNGLYIHLDWLF